MSDKARRSRRRPRRSIWPILAVCVLVIAATAAVLVFYRQPATSVTTSSSTLPASKYIILYINQGNGAVNESNFGSMLSFASSQGFNTVFFQVYREGNLLFDSDQLSFFVSHSHAQGIRIFFSLYITDGSQQIPTSVYGLGEDGISLDMSTISISAQSALLSQLQQGYTGLTAVTTTDLTVPLSPDLLVLETYGPQIQQYSQYIHPGVIASVGVFDTTSLSNYQQEYQYALANSDGVMVFDYAGLMKSGY